MKATLSTDAKSVTLQGRAWSETFALELLPQRVAFYEGLILRGGKNKQPGPWAKHYEPTLAALKAVQREYSERMKGGLI
ncbi:hypothetical protein QCN27_03745 [Cereibacter sp. SYSU M97828]|nr:hypothetical protein [Cereibacter flavus]